MTIKASDFRAYVLNPAMDALVPAGIPRNPVADALVFATIANESLVGTWLVQSGGGPALGLGQLEPPSETTLWAEMTTAEKAAVSGMMTPESLLTQLPYNLKLATALVRLFYWHKPFPLAAVVTTNWLWTIYRQFYNTSMGAAQMGAFIDNLSLTDIGDVP